MSRCYSAADISSPLRSHHWRHDHCIAQPGGGEGCIPPYSIEFLCPFTRREKDNGIKVVEPHGEMLLTQWEGFATAIANAR